MTSTYLVRSCSIFIDNVGVILTRLLLRTKSSFAINKCAWNYENDEGIDFQGFCSEWEYSFENNEFIVYNRVGFVYLC